MLEWIILFSIIGSVGAIFAATLFVFLGERVQKKLVYVLLSFATGTLLTAALMGLIPEAIEAVEEPHFITITILGGIIFFFFLEKFVIWRNCQNNNCEVHSHASGSLVLVGDAFHNFTDGIVIASAFLTNFYIGIAAGITILMHEIPQETGDFAILLHSGMSKKRALLYNLLSSCTTIPSAIISYYILDVFQIIIPYFLAFSASSFLYIALSDLTPELHQKTETKEIIKQLTLVLLGVIIMVLLLSVGTHTH